MNTSYIACVAGKSGGHIIPCLTYGRTIKDDQQKIIFFSNDTPLDYTLLKDQPDIAHHHAYSLTLTRSVVGLFKTATRFIKTTINAYKVLKKYRPTHIISTGGLVSVPVFLAAWFLRIPCTLFELNAVPGQAARVCAYFATTIHACFTAAAPYFPAHKTTIQPYPLKPEVLHAASVPVTHHSDKKTVLILGGSQGSITLNNCIKNIIATHPDIGDKITIIHQTGGNDKTDWPAWYAQHHINAIAFPFCPDLTPYYQLADLVIARAGAGTLFEIMAFKKKCIIVPLETRHTDHQVANALAMAQEYPQLCMVVRERELQSKPDIVYNLILQDKCC